MTKLFGSFVAPLAPRGIPPPSCAEPSMSEHNPHRAQACAFLHEAVTWDGADQTWNNAVTVPALQDVATRAMFGESPVIESCNGHGDALKKPSPLPRFSVERSPGGPWCAKLRLFCIGT